MCPLCGKNSSLRHLDPDSFDDDILAQDVVGLGPGRGFKTTGRHSILHSGEVKEKIMPRLFVLLRLMIEEGVVSADQVRKRLGLPDVRVVVEREDDEIQALREGREDTENRIRAVTSEIAEALGEDVDGYQFDDEGFDPVVGRLEYFAGRLMDEYGATADSEGVSMTDKMDQITNEIADALGQDAGDFTPEGDEDDSPLSKLNHYVRLMIDEYTALRDNQEGQW